LKDWGESPYGELAVSKGDDGSGQEQPVGGITAELKFASSAMPSLTLML
jgi:hypothetical protein